MMPPNEKQVEFDILKMAFDHPEVRLKIISGLTESDFYNNQNAENFRIMKDDYRRTGDICRASLKRVSKFCTPDEWVSPSFVDEYIVRLRDLTVKRSLFRASSSIKENLDKHPGQWLIQKVLEGLSKIKTTSSVSVKKACDVFEIIKEKWELNKGKDVVGVNAGSFLNSVISGYQAGHYRVIGAYTNYGKTTYMSLLASELVATGEAVAVFSVEMSKEQILEKILVQRCKDPLYNIRNRPQDYQVEIKSIVNENLYLFDDCFTIEEMQLELLGLKIEGKLPPVVFVDFLQNIVSEEKTSYERLTAITLKLQKLAKNLGVCVVVLSQISNEGQNTKTKSIPFKGSGEIASSADLGIQLLRDKEKEAVDAKFAELSVVVRKNRHGRCGGVQDLDLFLDSGALVYAPTRRNEKQKELWGK